MTAETDARRSEIEAQNESACPVVQALDEVGTPWRMNVIFALETGEKRFNGLKRATGARSKTLSDALDELVDAGVVDRRMEADAPVAVYYELTPKGEELLDALSELDEWAQRWDDAPDGPTPQLPTD